MSSILTMNKFDDMQNGYYWCSVKVKLDDDALTNPSRAVHILHQSPGCSTDLENGMCNRLNIYSSESPTLRCADQNVTLEIVEAQRCTFIQDLTTAVIQAPNSNSLPLPTTIIAAAAGGILLLLTAVILMYVLKMKVKRPKTVNRINLGSAFDNIHMNISFGEDKLDESQRESRVLCELNVSYEHSRSTMAKPLPTENIYETVH